MCCIPHVKTTSPPLLPGKYILIRWNLKYQWSRNCLSFRCTRFHPRFLVNISIYVFITITGFRSSGFISPEFGYPVQVICHLVLFPQNLAILFKSDDFISPEFSYPVICHLSSGFISPEFGYPVICHRSSGFISPEHFCIIRLSKKFQRI